MTLRTVLIGMCTATLIVLSGVAQAESLQEKIERLYEATGFVEVDPTPEGCQELLQQLENTRDTHSPLWKLTKPRWPLFSQTWPGAKQSYPQKSNGNCLTGERTAIPCGITGRSCCSGHSS